jgi:hypothetical protein
MCVNIYIYIYIYTYIHTYIRTAATVHLQEMYGMRAHFLLQISSLHFKESVPSHLLQGKRLTGVFLLFSLLCLHNTVVFCGKLMFWHNFDARMCAWTYTCPVFLCICICIYVSGSAWHMCAGMLVHILLVCHQGLLK